MKFVSALFLALAVMLTASSSGYAQAAGADSATADGGGEMLVVATRIVPPFAFRDNTGEWAGLSVELWRDIAARLNLAYRFEETTLEDMLEGTADGRFDAAVAALTVTKEREMLLDFTHPFFSTGLAIATVPGESSIWGTLAGLLSWEAGLFLVGVLLALLLVGVLLWWTERRRNQDYFGGPASQGIAGGIWLSLAMLVTSEYADQSPRSFAGRFVATAWVIASIILLTVFSGIVTSALTVQQIEGRVRGLADLPQMRVGTLPGSTSAEWLQLERIAASNFDTVEEALTAITEGRIDAFVYDAPILKYLAITDFADRVVILGDSFAPQDYAIALPEGSVLREPINRELLALKQSDIWAQRIFQYLGDR